MSFRYKWKNGSMPSRDQAASSDYLLDEGQFKSDKDRQLAEQEARRHLGVPMRTIDEGKPVLPHAAPPEE